MFCFEKKVSVDLFFFLFFFVPIDRYHFFFLHIPPLIASANKKLSTLSLLSGSKVNSFETRTLSGVISLKRVNQQLQREEAAAAVAAKTHTAGGKYAGRRSKQQAKVK